MHDRLSTLEGTVEGIQEVLETHRTEHIDPVGARLRALEDRVAAAEQTAARALAEATRPF